MSGSPLGSTIRRMSLYHSGSLLLGSLGDVSPIALALALTFHLAKLGTRARAWHNIVRAAYPADRLGFRETLAAFLAGVGVDAVVPARAGELVRLGLLRSRLASSTFPGLVSTLFAESAFDAVLTAVVIATAIGVGFGADVPGSAVIRELVAQHGLIVALVGSGVALAAGWLGFRLRARIRSFLVDARRGLAVFAQPMEYVRSVASWQALGWALRVASVYWFLVAFRVPASLGAALLVVAVQLVVATVPVTPGGAGPQQAVLVLALSATAAATVLGFGIGMQAATVISDLVLGGTALIFLTGSLRWRRLVGCRDAAPIRPIGASHATGGV
ncbi:MAG TPA: lysylphosphatidylglycerol synthase domain-containing protein [Thermoleophilaceae bacterium]|nr:lysylphosphatidylglycerol synthase domain-containing protein [Thermoleophilaceae bacterium]